MGSIVLTHAVVALALPGLGQERASAPVERRAAQDLPPGLPEEPCSLVEPARLAELDAKEAIRHLNAETSGCVWVVGPEGLPAGDLLVRIYLPLSEEAAALASEHNPDDEYPTTPGELFSVQRENLSTPDPLAGATEIEVVREDRLDMGDRGVLVHVNSTGGTGEHTGTTSLLVLDGERLTAIEYSVTGDEAVPASDGVDALLVAMAEDMGR
ncbi:hypothetical protein LG943_10725 [Streptomonospora sp. S1-112]|uniref:Uncharacterized protein n=1 Tax=Streptomonospora mangrovi TaxID=2883123 RepID=A0A9X3SDG8_9ACTN|nr:hypothetical protein [Streptomonospora mangrovi]MDA0564793.1 hypothetical protein [Streptomonospora mangrovi]